jgi:hypothetical protein
MAKQTINLGTGPNTLDGDKVRVAFGKVNDNFDELYLLVEDVANELSVFSTDWSGGRIVFEPASSLGTVGDLKGDLAFTESYIYYCGQDYSDGLAHIWKRMSWSADTW